MIRSLVLCSWNIQLKRNIRDWKVDDMGRLMTTLDGYDLGEIDVEDQRLDEDKGFW